MIGGANGTNEDAYALSRFAREVLETPTCRLHARRLPGRPLPGRHRRPCPDLRPRRRRHHPGLGGRPQRAAPHPLSPGAPRRPEPGQDTRRGPSPQDRSRRPRHPQADLPPRRRVRAPRRARRRRHTQVALPLAVDRVVAIVGIASVADGPKLAESVAALVRQKAGQAKILPLNATLEHVRRPGHGSRPRPGAGKGAGRASGQGDPGDHGGARLRGDPGSDPGRRRPDAGHARSAPGGRRVVRRRVRGFHRPVP